MALQHGVRIKIIGTGSIGRFSVNMLLQSVVLGFGAFGIAQALLDQYWYFFHAERKAIIPTAFCTLDLVDGAVKKEQ